MLIGLETLEQSLAVVETIDADDQIATLQALGHALHQARFCAACGGAGNGVGIDADRKHAGAYRVLAEYHASGCIDARSAAHGARRAKKSLAVDFGLEADQVVGEQVLEQLGMHGQNPQHLEVRKRHVQEEAEGYTDALSAQRRTEWNQVIVVHPDEIVLEQQRQQFARE